MTLTLELPVKTKVNPEGNSHVFDTMYEILLSI